MGTGNIGVDRFNGRGGAPNDHCTDADNGGAVER